jgi:glycosyltransferase involved in cell wall biosynthesis
VVSERPDIALVSLGTTFGWRRADAAFAEYVREAGASCELIEMRLGALKKLRRGMALTDLVEAWAARRAASRVDARTFVYSSITAALLRPREPYAVRFDTLAALNRPGPGGAWQRAREKAVLANARMLLPLSEAAAEAARSVVADLPPLMVVPPPVARVERRAEREIDAVAYAGNPDKRGLELICDAWQSAAPAGARLVVGGIEPGEARRYLRRSGIAEPEGVEWAGPLPGQSWLERVARARVFLSGSRYEDWGMAQMEALAAGTPLVTVPTPGPNVALPLARRLAPELVAGERSVSALAGALRAGLALDEEARRAYAERAHEMLRPYEREAVARVVAEEALPLLLTES